MNTIEIFGFQFRNAKDALISTLMHYERNEFEAIDELDWVVLPGLATAFNYYFKRGLTDDVILCFAKVTLQENFLEVTDTIMARTAWELADYSSNFEMCTHVLAI